jgi:2-oxoglutarate dehydrogenase E1 component
VAVDVTKKDGTRTLLVPNIKGADNLTFSQLLDEYDDVIRRAYGQAADLGFSGHNDQPD